VRALAAGDGDLRGSGASWSDVPVTPIQQRYLDSTTRTFHVPLQLAPIGTTLPCFALKPAVPASCSDVASRPGHYFSETYVGAYQPLPYVVPGVAARRADDETTAFRLARLAALAVCLALLAAGVISYADTPARLAASALAVTPSALFLMASLNTSGFEYASAYAFTAALLAALRRGRGWLLVSAAAFALAWSRPAGPGEVIVVAVALAAVRPRALRSHRAKWGIAAIAVAAASSGLWLMSSGLGGAPGLSRAWQSAAHAITQQVGSFGWTGEISVPRFLAWVWLLAIAAVLAAAARRRPFCVSITGAGYFAMLAILIVVNAGTGFGVGGRYLLPLLPLLPLVAAEVRPEWPRWCASAVLAAWPLLQAFGWLVNSHRYAVGIHGPLLFWQRPAWNPPGGWALWLAGVAMATALGIAIALSPHLPSMTPRYSGKRLSTRAQEPAKAVIGS
jgi:hypothetical protein